MKNIGFTLLSLKIGHNPCMSLQLMPKGTHNSNPVLGYLLAQKPLNRSMIADGDRHLGIIQKNSPFYDRLTFDHN
jgi:hypothetical protein